MQFPDKLFEKESFPSLVFSVGVIFVLLSFAAGITYEQWFPLAGYARVGVGVSGGTFVLTGILAFFWKFSKSTPKAKHFKVEILQPKEGDRVHRIRMQGTIGKEIPEGFTLWIFRIYPFDHSIAPICRAQMDPDGKSWLAAECDISGQSGDKRGLAVYLVGPNGLALIDCYQRLHEGYVKTRNQLLMLANNQAAWTLPAIRERTRDMIECKVVWVERS